jgi:hypothetical protein
VGTRVVRGSRHRPALAQAQRPHKTLLRVTALVVLRPLRCHPPADASGHPRRRLLDGGGRCDSEPLKNSGSQNESLPSVRSFSAHKTDSGWRRCVELDLKNKGRKSQDSNLAIGAEELSSASLCPLRESRTNNRCYWLTRVTEDGECIMMDASNGLSFNSALLPSWMIKCR